MRQEEGCGSLRGVGWWSCFTTVCCMKQSAAYLALHETIVVVSAVALLVYVIVFLVVFLLWSLLSFLCFGPCFLTLL